MIKKQFDVKQLAAFMSQKSVFDFVNAAETDKEKHERIEQMKHKFLSAQSNFSGENDSWVQAMGAPVEDVGNEEFSFMNDAEFNFAAFNRAAAAETGIQAIKRIVATHNVRESARAYALQRNSVVAVNRAKKAERDAQKRDKNLSHPFWY